ncbi:MAG: methyltransferase domain-containing protein [bacterium]|nr:methyltransferase domain-containing protein [bacterium]
MTFSDPQKNIQQFGLTEGMKIADLGAGSAAYTLAAAAQVGTSGRVYAVEVQKELLSNIKNMAAKQGFFNVEVIWGDIERLGGTKIKDHVLDAVIVSNVLFQAEDKRGVVAEVRRILKPKGRVLVVDWKDSFGGMGPHVDQVMSEQTARDLFENDGFTLDRFISSGDHHYGFVAVKQ